VPLRALVKHSRNSISPYFGSINYWFLE